MTFHDKEIIIVDKDSSSCAFASSALYRLATYDSRGSNCSSKAEGDLFEIEAIPRVPTE